MATFTLKKMESLGLKQPAATLISSKYLPSFTKGTEDWVEPKIIATLKESFA